MGHICQALQYRVTHATKTFLCKKKEIGRGLSEPWPEVVSTCLGLEASGMFSDLGLYKFGKHVEKKSISKSIYLFKYPFADEITPHHQRLCSQNYQHTFC